MLEEGLLMLKILKKLNKKEWSLVALSIIFVVGQVWLDLKIPDYMSKITRLIMTPGIQLKMFGVLVDICFYLHLEVLSCFYSRILCC